MEDKVENRPGRVKRLLNWYEQNERRVSTGSLLFGFIFDSLTLQRIDSLRENLWIGFNLLLASVLIIVLNRIERGARLSDGVGQGVEEGPAQTVGAVHSGKESKKHFWLLTILQFNLGAMLGAFFIFYFRSATLAAAWPFLIMLLSAMVANEVLDKRYKRLVFQAGFLYFAILLFSIFLVPVAIGQIGAWVFLLSGLVSLGLFWLFMWVLNRFARNSFRESGRRVWQGAFGVLAVTAILYFANLIPPIPLSLKDAGVYHYVERVSRGYKVVGEEGRWWHFVTGDEFNLALGDSAYAYSAVFAPSSLSTQIVHEWQYEDDGDWITASVIPLYVSGGRGEGFRTFSTKSNLAPGDWRVNVKTQRGQLIGRISFEVINEPTKAELIEEIKE